MPPRAPLPMTPPALPLSQLTGASQHPGEIGDIPNPSRCVTLSPAALAFGVTMAFVDRSSLLDGNATVDVVDLPSAGAIITTPPSTTTVTATDATTIATITAVVVTEVGGSGGLPAESGAGFNLGNATVTNATSTANAYHSRIAKVYRSTTLWRFHTHLDRPADSYSRVQPLFLPGVLW